MKDNDQTGRKLAMIITLGCAITALILLFFSFPSC